MTITYGGEVQAWINDTSGDPQGIDLVSGKLPTTETRTESNPILITKTVTTPGTGVALVATSTLCVRLEIEARKVGGVNTGTVYIGTSAVDKTSSQQQTLDPGDTYTLVAPAGYKIDLDSIYIDADNAADGVTGWYIGA